VKKPPKSTLTATLESAINEHVAIVSHSKCSIAKSSSTHPVKLSSLFVASSDVLHHHQDHINNGYIKTNDCHYKEETMNHCLEVLLSSVQEDLNKVLAEHDSDAKIHSVPNVIATV
jgi:hypothetical protein